MSFQNSKKQLTKNILSLTVVQIATYILPLISVPIITRIIGPSKFGIINFGVAFIAYFNLLISYSFDFSATRMISKNPNDADNRNKVFSEVFYSQCILFLVSTIIFCVLLFTVPALNENKVVMIFSYFLCLSTLFTQNWLFQAMQELTKVAIFNIISKILFTATIIIVVKKQEDYIWQPFLIGASQTIVAIWSFIWAIKRYNIQIQRTSLRKCLTLLNREKMIFMSLVFINLYSYTNTFILGIYQNQSDVGYFAAAQRLIGIAQSVLTMPFALAFYPFIGKAFGEGREKGLHVVQKLVPLTVVFIGTASVLMYLLGPYVIRAFYGIQFEAAIPAFKILSVIPLFYALNNLLGVQIMMNLAMDKYFFLISGVAGVTSVILNISSVKTLGYIGTSINLVFVEIFIFCCMYCVLLFKGLNPVNLKYFNSKVFSEYLAPLRRKNRVTA